MDAGATPLLPAPGLDQAGSQLPKVAAQASDAADAAYRKKATDAAIKFESFFIGNMLKQMRSSTRELAAEDSIYKDSVNSDMLDMADTLVADQLAGQRAFGIADMILRQLLPATPAAHAGNEVGNAAGDATGSHAGPTNKVVSTKSSRQT